MSIDNAPYDRAAHVAFLATWRAEYKALGEKILWLKLDVKKRMRTSRYAAGYDQNVLRGLQRDATERLEALKAARARLAGSGDVALDKAA